MKKLKRGHPVSTTPLKQVRLSTYVDTDIAEIVYKHADALNKSVSEYLGDILLMYIGRYHENSEVSL